MTRNLILTTATLAAFLAAGTPLNAAGLPSRRGETAAERERTQAWSLPLLAIGDELLAVHTAGNAVPGGTLGVAVFVEPGLEPASLSLWAGLKNGWGSQASRAEVVPGYSGLLAASVTIPATLPAQARLWISIGHERGSLVLPS